MEIVLLIFWLACAGFAFAVARSRGRSGCLWTVLGFLFGPLALIAVGFMPAVDVPAPTAPTGKVCPHCHVGNTRYATECRVCGRALA